MSGVYGTFYECFPELQEPFDVWLKNDKSDVHKVIAILMPDSGSGLKRRKFTSGNTALDITDDNKFYISTRYDGQVQVGSYIQGGKDSYIQRLTGELPFDKAAGYRIYTIERVTGSTPDKDQPLTVKEGRFA